MPKEILLIDDNAAELEIFADALHTVDKTVTCTQKKNLSEALEYLEHHSPGYIFIDFDVPTGDGVQYLSQLKKLSKLEKSKVILYASHIDDHLERTAIEVGAYRFIKKPNMIDLLARKLKEVLQADQSF